MNKQYVFNKAVTHVLWQQSRDIEIPCDFYQSNTGECDIIGSMLPRRFRSRAIEGWLIKSLLDPQSSGFSLPIYRYFKVLCSDDVEFLSKIQEAYLSDRLEYTKIRLLRIAYDFHLTYEVLRSYPMYSKGLNDKFDTLVEDFKERIDKLNKERRQTAAQAVYLKELVNG